jgi:hypothetical protein
MTYPGDLVGSQRVRIEVRARARAAVPDSARVHRELDVGRRPGELGDVRVAKGRLNAAHVEMTGSADESCGGPGRLLVGGEVHDQLEDDRHVHMVTPCARQPKGAAMQTTCLAFQPWTVRLPGLGLPAAGSGRSGRGAGGDVASVTSAAGAMGHARADDDGGE